MNKTTNKANWEAAYKHFVKYSGGECRFCDLDAAYCQKFVDYLLSAECYHNGKPMMPTTANNHLVKLKAALRMAYDDGHIKENIAKKPRNRKLRDCQRKTTRSCGTSTLSRSVATGKTRCSLCHVCLHLPH